MLPVEEIGWDSEGIGLLCEGEEDWLAGDNLVLMQSTGLKDKNGVELFEGDIVSFSGSLYTVAYDSENGAYKMISHDEKWVDDYILSYKTTESLTVVGNIYENKELLNND